MSRVALFGAIALVAVAAIVLGQTLYNVDETNYAVVRQFGEIRDVHAAPGLYFKTPFIQQVTYIVLRDLAKFIQMLNDPGKLFLKSYDL